MIDNTYEFERMSFMDGFFEYISFRTPLGVYCYTVMPFGLKNAGTTYQRAMSIIFREHLWKTIECYVDEIVVKSHLKEDHIQDLRTIFDQCTDIRLR